MRYSYNNILRKLAEDENNDSLLSKIVSVAADNVAEKIEEEQAESSSSSSSSSESASDENGIVDDQTVFVLDRSGEGPVSGGKDPNTEKRDKGRSLDSYLNLQTGKVKRERYKTVKGVLRLLN